jgi:adenylate cyclase
VKIQQVSEELGVRYLLEGSFRKSNDRIRITAQFIDALTGHHLWAERYDRNFEDIFTIQDEITMKILTELHVELIDIERLRGAAESTKNMDAYLKALQSDAHFVLFTYDNNIRSRQLAQEAIDLDPNFSLGWALFAHTYLMEVMRGWSKSPEKSIKKALEITQKLEEMGDKQQTPVLWAFIHWLTRQYEKAISVMESAIAMNPNNDFFKAFLGQVLVYAGKPQDGIIAIQKAMRLNPFYPTWYLYHLAVAYELTSRYEDAIEAYKSVLIRDDRDTFAHIGLASNYIFVGHKEKAKSHVRELLNIIPKFSLDVHRQRSLLTNHEALDRQVEALRKAGLN